MDRTSEAWRESCSVRSAASTSAGVSGRVSVLLGGGRHRKSKQGPPTFRPRKWPFSGSGENYFREFSGLGFDTLAGARCSTSGGGRVSGRSLRDLLNHRPEGDTMRVVTERDVVLTTQRLVLTSWVPDDVGPLLEVHSDPETMKFVRHGRPETRAETERLVDQYIAEHAARGWTKWRLADVDGGLVGRAGFGGGDTERQIAFAVRRSHWGRGLATEIAEALVGWHLSHAGGASLRAIAAVGNHASVRVLRESGFRRGREPGLRRYGVSLVRPSAGVCDSRCATSQPPRPAAESRAGIGQTGSGVKSSQPSQKGDPQSATRSITEAASAAMAAASATRRRLERRRWRARPRP